MKPLSYYGVSAQQVTTQPCHALKIEGSFRGAADAFLQVHDAVAAPADGAVPLKSWPIGAGSAAAPTPFFQGFGAGELPLQNGLYVCVSSTDGTKTLSASLMDLMVELVGAEEPAGLTVTGDLTTNVDHLQVWAEANAGKRLVKLEIGDPNNALAQTEYLMLFAVDAPVNGDTPLARFPITAGHAVRTLAFGDIGRNVMSQVGGAVKNGCTLWLSSTSGTLTKTAAGCVIKASYK